MFYYRIHIDHVLREFKTHLSWFGTLTSSKVTTLSVRYFYVPRTQYGQLSNDCISSNIISNSSDPLQLKQKQDNSPTNNLVFYEWQIPNTNLIICPPSAACVLIVVSVTSMKKKIIKHKKQSQAKDNEPSDSDTDNGVVDFEDKKNTTTKESE